MRKITSAHATFPLVMRSSRSLAKKACLNSGSSQTGSLALMGFSDLYIDIDPGLFRVNMPASRRSSIRYQVLQLRSVAMDQMPFQKVLHPVPRRVGGIHVSRNEEPSGFQHAVEDVHEALAYPV